MGFWLAVLFGSGASFLPLVCVLVGSFCGGGWLPVLVPGFVLVGVAGVGSVGVVRVVGSALVGVGGGRSWSTSLFWVGLLVPFWWGLGGWCGVGGWAFPVVLFDTCLSFLVFL